MKRVGRQVTTKYTKKLQLTKGDRYLEISTTTDDSGKLPTGSGQCKIKSGSISLEPDDKEEFLEKWTDAGEDIWDILQGDLEKIRADQDGENDGQTRMDYGDPEYGEDPGERVSDGLQVVAGEVESL